MHLVFHLSFGFSFLFPSFFTPFFWFSLIPSFLFLSVFLFLFFHSFFLHLLLYSFLCLIHLHFSFKLMFLNLLFVYEKYHQLTRAFAPSTTTFSKEKKSLRTVWCRNRTAEGIVGLIMSSFAIILHQFARSPSITGAYVIVDEVWKFFFFIDYIPWSTMTK